MKPLFKPFRRFAKDEDGLVMTEFLILLPLLVWTFMALFIYWDAFRTINQAQKAAYSVSDLISRQGEDIPPGFIDGMQTVTEYLMNDSPNVSIRVTSFDYNAVTDEQRVLFSRSPGNKMTPLTSALLNASAYRDRIPVMAPGDSLVLVETEVLYDPAFEVGISNHTFDNFIVTRPRTVRRVCLTTNPCPAELG